MVEPPDASRPPEQDFPDALPARRSRFGLSLIWLVPLIAVLIGGWLAAQAILQKGPTITISFKTGEGLEAGKTKIKYKDVEISTVKSVVLAPDHKRVIASAELSKDADNMLVDDTRFWVVRPRISGGTVSGLGTLIAGSYVGMDLGVTKTKRYDYVGLESPPVITTDVPGREFVLKSDTMGSLDVGAPVYFRRLQVGQITSYELDADGMGVTLHLFINAPYDKYVKMDKRFWQASGVDVKLDSTGVKMDTESLVSILVGGLAFEMPPPTPGMTDITTASDAAEAPAQHVYQLFTSRTEAMKRHDRIIDSYVFNFKESVRGLSVGAEVDFRGIVLGEVTAIYTRYDPVKREFSIPVRVNFYPERFSMRAESGTQQGRLTMDRRKLVEWMVEHGFRAQLRTGSILTGQRYIAVDFFKDAASASIDWNADPPELPTVPGGLQSLQDSIQALVTKLNKIPFEGIGQDVRDTLKQAQALVRTLDTEIAPEAKTTLAAARNALDSTSRMMQNDSPLQANAAETMKELSRTAAAFRNLAEYLERHPEAILRGKPEDKK
ncbi:Paraquat-inducible protein B [Candidatus Burkholderia verschuerenii]|uniref:Paraquat-inducible protein B n=1 Tax=Candidatus Burkholderia verschuerenii TaxID=242163 RepID=A0A0L0M9Q8_9BURK|nr:MlaD family protein [Candidatus Burkholderia verschuerenii]KND59073.1 Paraquat-inducible protein B [Candidatus Burkholderia verschuerenii]